MVSVKNKQTAGIDDGLWENIGSFISNLAQSNESIESKIENMTPARIEPFNAASTNPNIRIFSKTPKPQRENPKKINESHGEFSEKYQSLQTDIKGLLDELQEIKKARIDLQKKIEQIQQ
ncbi:MAG: hypothetical protein OEV66_05780 [Spirochaetia bacterium]|nr:hypothetical protein [Spirochaetia bacterium]